MNIQPEHIHLITMIPPKISVSDYCGIVKGRTAIRVFNKYKDLKQRFDKHQKGLVDSTKDRRPLKLVYYEACFNQQDATKREKYLKTYHGRMFIKRRLESYLTG